MLRLRALKHRRKCFASKPDLKLAPVLMRSPDNTSSPPDPGVDQKTPVFAIGEKGTSSSVPANCETFTSATLTTGAAVGRRCFARA